MDMIHKRAPVVQRQRVAVRLKGVIVPGAPTEKLQPARVAGEGRGHRKGHMPLRQKLKEVKGAW